MLLEIVMMTPQIHSHLDGKPTRPSASQPSNPLHPIPDQCQPSNPLPANPPELEIQRKSTPSNPRPMLTIESITGAVLPVPLSYALPAADALRWILLLLV